MPDRAALLAMDASRELDAIVAERFLSCDLVQIGSQPRCNCIGYPHNSSPSKLTYVPHYSTDIAAADPLLDVLTGRGFGWTIYPDHARVWEPGDWKPRIVMIEPGSTARPLLICRLVLATTFTDAEWWT